MRDKKSLQLYNKYLDSMYKILNLDYNKIVDKQETSKEVINKYNKKRGKHK